MSNASRIQGKITKPLALQGLAKQGKTINIPVNKGLPEPLKDTHSSSPAITAEIVKKTISVSVCSIFQAWLGSRITEIWPKRLNPFIRLNICC
ncbi:hypothetical protein VCRA2111O136_110158 [Vibrio crassostreae]|nr:hypothetical protein VCRA2111O136_110158 [Vibrio crassostreae]